MQSVVVSPKPSRLLQGYYLLIDAAVVLMGLTVPRALFGLILVLVIMRTQRHSPSPRVFMFSPYRQLYRIDSSGTVLELDEVRLVITSWTIIAFSYRHHNRRKVVYLLRDMLSVEQWKELQRLLTASWLLPAIL
jgi:hypothetical protein